MNVSGKPTAKPSTTDWAKVDALKDEEQDYSENPPLDEGFWSEAALLPGKQQVTLRLDRDVLRYFKGRGKGYQTAINAVLRRYVEVQKPKP